jgi:predicted RNase H-like HicB family nuclease
MKKFELDNIVWKEGKYFVAQCLNIDISSFGKTKNEALKNLKEAIDLYFEDAEESEKAKLVKTEKVEIIRKQLQYA